jgi:hypothetical protein
MHDATEIIFEQTLDTFVLYFYLTYVWFLPWKLHIDFNRILWYIGHKKSTHSKVDAPEKSYLPLSERRPFRLPTGWAFLFPLVFPIEIGKQCNSQTTKGYQQANNPYEYQYDIRSRHMHHLPSYVFRLNRL